MSWVLGGKTVSVNGCHYGRVGNFLDGKIKFGGISAGGLTAEAVISSYQSGRSGKIEILTT